MSEKISRLVSEVRRFKTFAVRVPESNQAATGHLALLKSDYHDAHRCYGNVYNPTATVSVLHTIAAYCADEYINLASLQPAQAELRFSYTLCQSAPRLLHPSADPNEVQRMELPISVLCDSAYAMASSNFGRNDAPNFSPYILAVSALASFLWGQPGDARYKCDLALKRAAGLAPIDTLEEALIDQLKRTLQLLSEIVTGFAIEARNIIKSYSKVAVVRDVQLKMAGRSLTSSSATTSNTVEWASLVLFGSPFNVAEGAYFTPEERYAFVTQLNTKAIDL